MSTAYESIPGVGRPAREALRAAGYPDLESLDGVDYADLAALHGVGKRGLERLHAALLEQGMGLTGEVPDPEPRHATFTSGHTGEYAEDIKTRPTERSAARYVEELDTPRRVEHGRLLLEIFGRVTGEEPVMWGPSMIGYGQVHYRYDTGREGDTFRVGFSPRKEKISLYGLTGLPESAEQLARLGKYTTGKACLYINKPEDVDLEVLEEMIEYAWNAEPGGGAG
ncbi:DUF1801 domain-containing protein [Corynebacterium halotolerans]|uniref:YdhG-like domain-containing protein n=1 Tax=Corynebacterium halotolerans YIM 70093 = DSM 44683 TaxID=1121362 RepID=M1P3C8_9CORY|nr:DUF1801 domain-containing protein [Corynebacterium halotolerans]AGF71191.1 hypothetical protein A605_00875 [Corynebacterium halotolerans YIM 70093 = DSM 44683]